MENKVCIKCGEDKPISEYYIRNKKTMNYYTRCKNCLSGQKKIYYEKNKESVKNRVKNYRELNKVNVKEREKEYRNKNKEKIKLYKKNYKLLNKEILKEKNKEYRNRNKTLIKNYKENNKEILRKKNNEYVRNKRMSNPKFKLTNTIRTSILKKIKGFGYTKKSKTYDILGCSYEDFKTHIESKFQEWMTWDNHGLYNGEEKYGWDLDHIIPVSSSISEEDVIRLNHHTNFQPLCSYINRVIKRNNI
jgi:hypothetical protein